MEIETKLDRLLDLQLDGSLSQTEYAIKKHKLIRIAERTLSFPLKNAGFLRGNTMPRREAPRQPLTISLNVKLGGHGVPKLEPKMAYRRLTFWTLDPIIKNLRHIYKEQTYTLQDEPQMHLLEFLKESFNFSIRALTGKIVSHIISYK